MNPTISIIIVSYNTSAILRDCLSSVARETSVSYEIIVIDNVSADDSAEMVEREFPSVRLVRNAENVGFAKANNQGLALARGEFTLFLNPDTVILDGAIDVMVAFLRENPRIGALGPHTYNADGKTTQATALRLPTFWRVFHAHAPLALIIPFYRPAAIGEYIPRGSGAVEVVKGSCIIMPTALAREIGGMNETYFMYSEELDLCKGVSERGCVVFYYAEAHIIHLGGASTAPESEKMAVELLRSAALYFAQHNPRALRAVRALYFIGSAWRWVAWSALETLGRNREEARLKRRCHQAMMRWLWKDFDVAPKLEKISQTP